jgi:hypothetical protein
MSPRRGLMPTAATVALSLMCAGCGMTTGDKSGGTLPPQILVLANNERADVDGPPAVGWFVKRVTRLSHGRVSVRVVSARQGGGDEPGDPRRSRC